MQSNQFIKSLCCALALVSPLAAIESVAAPQIHDFNPAPVSQPIYAIQSPSTDPQRQIHTITAADGVQLYMEAWLPAAQNGNVPPEHMPVVVELTPYSVAGSAGDPWALTTFVPRGYAYVSAHVRGTGSSGGCINLQGALEADDSARVIEFLGRDAPYSDGKVGTVGLSYPGGTALSVAGRGDPQKIQYLKAVISRAPFHSMHDAQWTLDGVGALLYQFPGLTAPYYGLTSIAQVATDPTISDRIPARIPCLLTNTLQSSFNIEGNHTPWYQERDNRAWTSNITAATLISHGHADLVPTSGSPPAIQRGLFDKFSPGTPLVGLFGIYGHNNPPREDFTDIGVAWFDRWLKGLSTGVEQWPKVQVQGNDFRWREESAWPIVQRQAGQLALNGGFLGLQPGVLGASQPSGSTSYLEASLELTDFMLPGTYATFKTGALQQRMELTGQPVLDLWVKLTYPDTHIVARIETFDASGEPIPFGITYGMRSGRHLAPYQDGRFVQASGVAPPVGQPFRMQIRFQPTDLVIPAGGSMRIVIAGSLIVHKGLESLVSEIPTQIQGPTLPSFAPGIVKIYHNCQYPSALRFEMPSAQPTLLNVNDALAPTFQQSQAGSINVSVDGGGLASASVCGQAPIRSSLWD